MKMLIALALLTVSCVCSKDYTEVLVDGEPTYISKNIVDELPDFLPNAVPDPQETPQTPSDHVDDITNKVTEWLKVIAVIASLASVVLGVLGRWQLAQYAIGLVIGCVAGIYGIAYIKIVGIVVLWCVIAGLVISLVRKYKVIEELSKHFDDTEGDKKISEEAHKQYLKHRTKGDTNENPKVR